MTKQDQIRDLQKVLATQLEYGLSIARELDDTIETANGLLSLIEVLVMHINVLHADYGLEPIDNPFEGVEFVTKATAQDNANV